MGQDISDFYASICGDPDINPVEMIRTERKTRNEKEMPKYINMTKNIDKKSADGTLRVEDYLISRGKTLYLFYLKTFDIQFKVNGTSWIHENKENHNKQEPQFDFSKADPFGFLVTSDINQDLNTIVTLQPDRIDEMEQQIQESNIRNKELILKELKEVEFKYGHHLEIVWDVLLGNKHNNFVKIHDPDLDSMIDTLEMRDLDMNNWSDLNEFERKAFLLRFCVYNEPIINRMGFDDTELVKLYNNLSDETLDEMMVLNQVKKVKNENENCVIL
eukprot:273713_1